jgi:hypothetical protein
LITKPPVFGGFNKSKKNFKKMKKMLAKRNFMHYTIACG